MISQLIQLQARAKALGNRLKELDTAYRSGNEDIGRVTRLKSTLETERLEILTTLQELMKQKEMPTPLVEAIEQAQGTGGENKAKKSLERLAKERGWGGKIITQIKQHRGDILDLIISIALKVAKELMTGVP